MRINRGTFIGPILILLGVFLFIRGDISFGAVDIFTYFWPSLFILPVGVFFHWLYFSILHSRGVGVLVPGGTILAVAITCQISMLFDNWGVMWPGFILAPAVGLFELYWYGGRNKWLLIPINILTALSVLFFTISSIGTLFDKISGIQPILAALLIIGGTCFMFTRKRDTF